MGRAEDQGSIPVPELIMTNGNHNRLTLHRGTVCDDSKVVNSTCPPPLPPKECPGVHLHASISTDIDLSRDGTRNLGHRRPTLYRLLYSGRLVRCLMRGSEKGTALCRNVGGQIGPQSTFDHWSVVYRGGVRFITFWTYIIAQRIFIAETFLLKKKSYTVPFASFYVSSMKLCLQKMARNRVCFKQKREPQKRVMADELRLENFPKLKMQLLKICVCITDMWSDDYKKIHYIAVTATILMSPVILMYCILFSPFPDIPKSGENILCDILEHMAELDVTSEPLNTLTFIMDRGSNMIRHLTVTSEWIVQRVTSRLFEAHI
ncbi:hypothetical protein ANN_14074 [Periplaneta americana]|uniref:Uncharacterized protein n=1 Tax=Periplaneta americana TaxID=6978 RepID=A0ABQ8SXF7_PERAM|nr:hypothetical protein ANN_14074 [Periplaneta americana]